MIKQRNYSLRLTNRIDTRELKNPQVDWEPVDTNSSLLALEPTNLL